MVYNKTYNLIFIVLISFCLILFESCLSKEVISNQTPKTIDRNDPNIETAETSFSVNNLVIDSKLEFVKLEWILCKNSVKDSGTEFDIRIDYSNSLMKYISIVEYSPINREYKKITNLEYNTESNKLIFINSRRTLVSGISYDPNTDWDKELKYNSKLTIEFYSKLVDEIINKL